MVEGGDVATRRLRPAATLPLPVAGDALHLDMRHAEGAYPRQGRANDGTPDAEPAGFGLDIEPFDKPHRRRPADGARRHFPHETPHGRAVDGQHGDEPRIVSEPRRVAGGVECSGSVGLKDGIRTGKVPLMLAHQGGEQELEPVAVARPGGADYEAHARPPAISFGCGAARRRRRLRGAGLGSSGGADATEAAEVGRSTAGRSAAPALTAASGNTWCTR